MYLAPIEYDFCMILNCIFCIIYCCIYYVCNNLVALLKFVQYVRIKKYLLLSRRSCRSHHTRHDVSSSLDVPETPTVNITLIIPQ